jgi:hypothetical protein
MRGDQDGAVGHHLAVEDGVFGSALPTVACGEGKAEREQKERTHSAVGKQRVEAGSSRSDPPLLNEEEAY